MYSLILRRFEVTYIDSLFSLMPFLTCENAKRNERVIGDDNRYANFHSLTPSVTCKLFWIVPLTTAQGFRGKGIVV